MTTEEEIYNKYLNGDYITDQELENGIVFFHDLQLKLFSLGKTFRLPAKEANDVFITFCGYKISRNKYKTS